MLIILHEIYLALTPTGSGSALLPEKSKPWLFCRCAPFGISSHKAKKVVLFSHSSYAGVCMYAVVYVGFTLRSVNFPQENQS